MRCYPNDLSVDTTGFVRPCHGKVRQADRTDRERTGNMTTHTYPRTRSERRQRANGPRYLCRYAPAAFDAVSVAWTVELFATELVTVR